MNKNLQDLAWSVLPKEFKEEVKKEYRKCLNEPWWGSSYLRGRLRILRELFGEHNLTSDSEGEEMLTVPRKKVQDMYAEIINDIRDYNGENPEMVGTTDPILRERAAGMKAQLRRLFGSKCLPDDKADEKVDDKADENVPYENLSDVDSSEPNPAEPKFKVGDKVKIAKNGNVYNNSIGEIIDISSNGSAYILFCNGQAWFRLTDLEPYTEPYTEPEEVARMKPIASKVSVYLTTKEEDEEFRLLLHENGFKWNSNRSLISLSCWSSYIEDSHTHYVYPDKTVTYYGDKTSDTLTFSEFKKQYFGGNVNHRQNIANCDKQFDNILKDGFSKERRLNIATQIMSAILSNQMMLNNLAHGETTAEGVVRCVVDATMMYTDALIVECEKGGADEKD